MVPFYNNERHQGRKQPYRKNIDIDDRKTQQTRVTIKQQHKWHV